MLEIVHIDEAPVARRRYLNAARGGGTEVGHLAIERGRVRALPADLDAVVLTSDLQGIVPDPHTREATLLGVAVAEALEELAFDAVLPPAARTGVILAGDLYSVPAADKRGGFGGVEAVWAAFADRFAWVVGVAGNHDDVTAVAQDERVVVLDEAVVELDGLRLGGVGLVAGNPAKRGRRAEADQLDRIALVAVAGVDVLVLHEGPHGDADQRGQPRIRAIVEAHRVPLTVCGHDHWPRALAHHEHGQILNVDARVVVLTR
ncbi:MAG: metallophosphoesterase [Kofleriaceae bacterium]